jgi:DNA polymerase III subunit alpha
VRVEPSSGAGVGADVGAQWLLDLGEASRLWPSDEALARLGSAAEVVFEA